MITAVDHVHVTALDMDKSIDFYTNVLGFRFLRRVSFGPPEARRELAYVGLGEVLLELLPPAAGSAGLAAGAGRPFSLTVQDMAGTVAELRSKGVEVTQEVRPGFSFTGTAASIKDPSGIVIELREWKGADSPYYPDWQPERADVVRTA